MSVRRSDLLSIFLCCFSLLVFELLCSRVLAIVIGSQMVYFVIAIAMLGMSVAASLVAVTEWKPPLPAARDRLAWLALALSASYAASLAVVTRLNALGAAAYRRALGEGGLPALVSTMLSSDFLLTAMVGGVLAAPYFVFGLYVGLFFNAAPGSAYHRLYFSDLLGAALGCVVFVAAMEASGFAATLLCLLATSLAGALCLRAERSPGFVAAWSAAAIVLGLVAALPGWSRFVEPEPEVNTLGRNYDFSADVASTWRKWNSYTRVARILAVDKGSAERSESYNLGKGEGQAWALAAPRPGGVSILPRAPSRLTALFHPQDVLVVFAGVGADMLEIDQLLEGRARIDGVELNRDMVEHALADPGLRLAEFFARPGIRMHVAEGREFLERTRARYDAILLSWSGASVSYYAGTSGHTTQYMYTLEAFDALLDHLRPEGVLIVTNTNKAHQLLILKRLFESRGLGRLRDAVVVLRQTQRLRLEGNTSWDSFWDENRLLLRPAGFGAEELAALEAEAAATGYEIVTSPRHSDPRYAIYRELMETDDPAPIVARAVEENGIELAVATDDRPFALDLAPRTLFFTPLRWLGGSDDPVAGKARFKIRFFLLTCLIMLISAVLIVLPLLIKARGLRASLGSFEHLLYFTCLGTGFMLIEVGFVQKLGLLLGNPGYAIAVVLGALIFATGLGSLVSERIFAGGRMRFAGAVLTLLGAVGLALGLTAAFGAALLGLPLAAKIAYVVAVLTPMGLAMGQLFPQGLRIVEQRDEHLVPWAWAVNGIGGTLAAGMGIVLSQSLGFTAVILLGAAIYALILALPSYR